MRKTIKLIIVLSLFFAVLYSCNSNDTVTEKPTEAVSYNNLKIGNLTSGEIGKLHNNALQVLKDNGNIKGTISEIIATLQKNNIDNRISNIDIKNSINNLYQIHFFTTNLNSTFSKKVKTDNFQEDSLNFLISKNEISLNAKNEIGTIGESSVCKQCVEFDRTVCGTNGAQSGRESE